MAHLPECLAALAAQSVTGFETLLVDNCSSDESVTWARGHYPEVRVLELPANGGFPKAVNAGVLASKSEYVALLNNDTAVDAGWLGALLQALDEHPDYDFAASKMILYSDSERINAAGDVWSMCRMSGKNRGFGKPASRYDTMERVLGACAGAALYRRALFDTVGLLDEDFFLMHEDTDFNLRCLIAGKRCLYVPAARVRHKWRSSVDAAPFAKMQSLSTRNSETVIARDLPMCITVLGLITWGYRALRHTVLVRPSNWRLMPAALRQAPRRIRMDARAFRAGLAQRREVWRLQTVGTREILRWLLKGSGPV
jgi:GT2 family glycosyltransferase